jgi:cell pole-organizing protein PopZ
MEDILASIRRILSEDEPQPDSGSAPQAPAAEIPASPQHAVAPPPDAAEVFTLEESMIVTDTPAVPPAAAPAPAPTVTPRPSDLGHLVAPEAEAAAAGSVTALLRAVVAGRDQVHVYRGGPTIEDLVREEIRPLLKTWLDANLPPIVERLVRTEIERVVGRALS